MTLTLLQDIGAFNVIINSLSEVMKLSIPGLAFSGNIEEIQCGISLGYHEVTTIFRGNKEKITKILASFPICVI